MLLIVRLHEYASHSLTTHFFTSLREKRAVLVRACWPSHARAGPRPVGGAPPHRPRGLVELGPRVGADLLVEAVPVDIQQGIFRRCRPAASPQPFQAERTFELPAHHRKGIAHVGVQPIVQARPMGPCSDALACGVPGVSAFKPHRRQGCAAGACRALANDPAEGGEG